MLINASGGFQQNFVNDRRTLVGFVTATGDQDRVVERNKASCGELAGRYDIEMYVWKTRSDPHCTCDIVRKMIFCGIA